MGYGYSYSAGSSDSASISGTVYDNDEDASLLDGGGDTGDTGSQIATSTALPSAGLQSVENGLSNALYKMGGAGNVAAGIGGAISSLFGVGGATAPMMSSLADQAYQDATNTDTSGMASNTLPLVLGIGVAGLLLLHFL